MPQRRSKRGRDVTPTQGAPSSAYSKRQRVSTQRFEAGINPITPPASTKRPVSRPVSRLPSQVPNDALFVRENTHVGGEDSDHVGQDDEADPNPEDAVDTEPLPDAEEDLANEAAEESEASSEAYEVIATIRLRATFSDIERQPLHLAADTWAEYKISDLTNAAVWNWVDEVIVSQSLYRVGVEVASLSAELWSGKGANKGNRPVKRLRRDHLLDLRALKELATSVDRNTSERLCIDLNLYLNGEPAPTSQNVAPPPPRSSQLRPRTATVIQEEGLAGVVAAELIGAGAALAIKDTWRCEDRDCKNWPYTCWLPRTGLPNRWESHYPVNANIVAMWAKAVDDRQCTVQDPNDRIKSAIMRARERSEVERVRRRQQSEATGLGGVIDEVRELQKSLLMAQLQQLNTGLASSPSQSGNWQPFEYEFWGEIAAHTRNFLQYFRSKWDPPGAGEFMDKLEREVVSQGHIDINMLMCDGENGVTMTMWVEHFEMPAGGLLQLRRHALKWRKTYSGLSEADFEYIHSTVSSTQERRQQRAQRSPLSDIAGANETW
jgi:hypothetical protein